MAEKRVLFGTDGIRGRANQGVLTPELALAFGRAVAAHFGERSADKSAPILIGRDTRISGPMLEHAVAAGIASMGVQVLLLGVIPTPAIAYLTRHLQAQAGIVISASHNSFEDNGLKIFQGNGLKCDDETEARLTDLILGNIPNDYRAKDAAMGRIEVWPQAAQRYADLVVAHYQPELDLTGLRVVVDTAYGAAHLTTPLVLRALGAEVVLVDQDAPTGLNINAGFGSTHPELMQAAVKAQQAHLGLAHDGDADRLICSDERGDLLDGDEMLAVLGLDLLRRGKLNKNTLVATVMSNLGLDECFAQAGGKVIRAGVGDRYVLEQMVAYGLNLGGEQSGHMILWDHNTTGDGLVSALELLRVMRSQKLPLSQLRTGLRKYPQQLVNISVRERIPLAELPEINDVVKAVEVELGTQGRVLLRYSGTEAKLRLLVEVREETQLQPVVDRLLVPIKKCLGSAN